MERIQRLFLLLIVIGPLHMAEQLLTGIEELDKLRRGLEVWYGWFPATFAGSVTVILITLAWLAVLLMLDGMMRGGVRRLVVLAVIGSIGAQEVHHVVEAVIRRGYDPGLVTSIPYAIVGNLLNMEVWREFQRSRQSARPRTPLAAGLAPAPRES